MCVCERERERERERDDHALTSFCAAPGSILQSLDERSAALGDKRRQTVCALSMALATSSRSTWLSTTWLLPLVSCLPAESGLSVSLLQALTVTFQL